MPIVTPDDVHALQVDVEQEADGLAQALKTSVYNNDVAISDPIIPQWQRMMTRVQTFLRENPSWLNTASQMDRGQQLQRELGPWHARMAAAGVKNVPAMPPQPPAPTDLFGNVENIVLALVVIMAMRELH